MCVIRDLRAMESFVNVSLVYYLLLYLSLTTRVVIGQFSWPLRLVNLRPAKV